MTWLLPMIQGFAFANLAGRFFETPQSLRYALWGAVAFPIASWALAKLLPRFSFAVWFSLVSFWGGALGYSAFQDPSLHAWEWTLLFTVGGLVFGAGANYPLLLSRSTRMAHEEFGRRVDPAGHESTRARSEVDPWMVLGVSPEASQSQIKLAYFTLMQKYHPGEAGTTELRRLAEDATAQIKRAYDTVRRESS